MLHLPVRPRRVRGRLTGAALACCALLPFPVPAQTPRRAEVYLARNDALPGSPTLAGGAFSTFVGPLGLRASGGVSGTRQPAVVGAQPQSGLGALGVDADVTLTPSRASRAVARRLGSFSPFALAGVGVGGVRPAGGATRGMATWSYGAGVSYRLLGGLSLGTELRYRTPIGTGETPPAGFSRAPEYRLALALDFGGGPSSSPAPSLGVARSGASPGSAPESAGAAPAVAPRGASPPRLSTAAPASSAALAALVVATAERQLGTAYRYGGSSPVAGFDCSGFVQFVFAQHAVRLPRTSRHLATAGSAVSPRVSALQPGDLLLFAAGGRRVDHVAIYAGGNRIIHSTSTGGGVRYDDLDTPRGKWFMRRLVAARRVLGGWAPVPRLGVMAEGDTLDPPDRAPVP